MTETINVKEHVNLQPFNTLAVNAQARYFIEVTSEQELSHALGWYHRQQGLPLLVLSGGSNIILSGDFEGLVLHMAIEGRQLLSLDEEHVHICFGGGENWHQLVESCLDEGYYGLENLALIPGYIGAAPIQNIGAYGVELCDVFESLTAIEIDTEQQRTFTREQCDFSYRDSAFKNRYQDKYIITSVTLRLNRLAVARVDYPALNDYLTEQGIESPNPKQVFDAVCAVRQSKLPDPAKIPNVGSFFKNPIVSLETYHALLTKFPEMVGFDMPNHKVKLAAGWLIDQAGWKGHKSGDVAVHDKQALVLTNPGGASGEVVMQLALRIQQDVRQRFGVKLEPEPRVY